MATAMRVIRDITPDDIIYNHFVQNVEYPIKPGGDFCLKTPAMVVMPFETTAKTIPLSEL